MTAIIKTLDDQQICIREFKKGKLKAYEQIFHHFYEALCYFSEKIVHDKPGAEDLVTEVFIKLWENRFDLNFDHMGAIRSYLYSCTRNASINFLHQAQRSQQRERLLAMKPQEQEEYVLNNMIRTEVIREVHLALEELPPKCKKVFLLAIHHGCTTEEIATRLGISVSTVRNHKAYGLYLLRKRYPEGIAWVMFCTLLAESSS